MNALIKTLLTIGLLLSINTAQATVDGMTSAWIVVVDIQDDSPEYMSLQQAPVIGCYGLAQGPQLVQFTSEYRVKASVGCGYTGTATENINALSCATLVDSVESDDYISFKKIVLDISQCIHKDNARFITLIRTAAARNFPQTKNGHINKSKEVELILIK